MTEEQFAAWLVENGFAEGVYGYGHAAGAEIAEALFGSGFVIVLDAE